MSPSLPRALSPLSDTGSQHCRFECIVDSFACFRRAMAKAGLEIPTAYIKEGPHARHVAHRLTAELLSLEHPPTAVVTASDTQALGVLDGANNLGVSVPLGLSVIGFDDIEAAEYVGLTTLRQPLSLSGARGAEQIGR